MENIFLLTKSSKSHPSIRPPTLNPKTQRIAEPTVPAYDGLHPAQFSWPKPHLLHQRKTMNEHLHRLSIFTSLSVILFFAISCHSGQNKQNPAPVPASIQAIFDKPLYQGATWG